MAADSRAVKMVAALLECFFITESANLKKKVDRIPCAALLATSKQVTTECPLNTLGIHPDGKSYTSGGEAGLLRIHHFDKEYFEHVEKEEKLLKTQEQQLSSQSDD